MENKSIWGKILNIVITGIDRHSNHFRYHVLYRRIVKKKERMKRISSSLCIKQLVTFRFFQFFIGERTVVHLAPEVSDVGYHERKNE